MSALKQTLVNKTDEQLKYYIEHVNKHTEEAVWLALEELWNRKVELPENIEETLKQKIAEKPVTSASPGAWKKNVVTDIEAPEYYSKNAIYIFSILFSVFFGSIMLAINLKSTKKVWWVPIIFGFVYTSIIILISDYLPRGLPYTFIVNALGVVIMYELFWNKVIGRETKYRAKPIWIPLLIAMAIFIPFMIWIFYNMGAVA